MDSIIWLSVTVVISVSLGLYVGWRSPPWDPARIIARLERVQAEKAAAKAAKAAAKSAAKEAKRLRKHPESATPRDV